MSVLGLHAAASAQDGRADDMAPVPGAIGSDADATSGEGDGRPSIRARSEAATAWQIDLEPGPMRLFVDSRDGTPYWYMTYKATNNSNSDQRFSPKFELVDDEGRITVSGQGVPSEVSRMLLRRLESPLVEDQNTILGDILIGEGNAKEGIVVFKVTSLASKELFVFVSNLSSERQFVRDGRGQQAEVRKQYRIAYAVPGDAIPRGSEALELLDEGREPNPRWVWR